MGRRPKDESPVTPCFGQSALFDSTDLIDHRKAVDICATCPVIEECRKQLDDAIRAHGYGPYVGPRGTWAGKFLNAKPRAKKDHASCGTISGKRRHARIGEPSCDLCREAAVAYNREWRARKARSAA